MLFSAKKLGLVVALACCMSHAAWAEDKAGVTGAPDEVLLRNDLVTVTRGDFEAEIAKIPAQNRDSFLSSSTRIEQIMDGIVVTKSFANEARRLGLDQDPKIQAQIKLAVERALAIARMEQFISQAKADVAKMNMETRAQELYKAQPDAYKINAQVRAEHVLIDTKKRSKEEALKLAQQVYADAKAGKPFGELADKFSEDPSAKTNHGDLGFFEAPMMVKPFSDAAFALEKTGDISQPVETQFGYHVIRLVEKKPAGMRPFEEVKGQLIQKITDDYVNESRTKKINDFKDSSKISYNIPALQNLKVNLDFSKLKADTAAAAKATDKPAVDGAKDSKKDKTTAKKDKAADKKADAKKAVETKK